MNPETIAKANTEHSHQCAFFCAMREYQSQYPQLAFLHSIPNGGERNVAVAARLKAEGVKAGVPDVFLPFPSRGYHGLYLEFKKPKIGAKAAGKLSKDQILWAAYLHEQNYSYFVVHGYLQAVDIVLGYLGHSK